MNALMGEIVGKRPSLRHWLGAAALCALGASASPALSQTMNPAYSTTPNYAFQQGNGVDTTAPLGSGRSSPDALGREALRSFIVSLQRGKPNYGGMTPELASTVREQLPALQQKARDWGAFKSIYGFRASRDAPRVYVATFERGKVAWSVGPLARNGKLAALAFQDVS